MKKIGIVALLCIAVMTLAACSGGSSNNDTTTASNTQTNSGNTGGSTSADGYTFTVNGVKIAMHENAASIVESLGDPNNYSEEASCAFEGLDCTFTYDDFILRTYPTGDENFVYEIDILSDMVETEEGLTIGDSTEKVEQLYSGATADATGSYILESGDMTLEIRTADGKVTAIYYTATLE